MLSLPGFLLPWPPPSRAASLLCCLPPGAPPRVASRLGRRLLHPVPPPTRAASLLGRCLVAGSSPSPAVSLPGRPPPGSLPPGPPLTPRSPPPRPSSGDWIQPITTRHRVQPLLHVCRRGELNQINFNSHSVTQLGCGGGICGTPACG